MKQQLKFFTCNRTSPRGFLNGKQIRTCPSIGTTWMLRPRLIRTTWFAVVSKSVNLRVLSVDWDHVYTLVDREASTFLREAQVDRLGPFTVLDKLAQKKRVKWHPFINFNTKNVFHLIPTKISKFHASKQNEQSGAHRDT